MTDRKLVSWSLTSLFRLIASDKGVSVHDSNTSPIYGMGMPLYFRRVVSSSIYLSFLLPSPNLSRRRLDVCHTSTHDVALVRI